MKHRSKNSGQVPSRYRIQTALLARALSCCVLFKIRLKILLNFYFRIFQYFGNFGGFDLNFRVSQNSKTKKTLLISPRHEQSSGAPLCQGIFAETSRFNRRKSASTAKRRPRKKKAWHCLRGKRDTKSGMQSSEVREETRSRGISAKVYRVSSGRAGDPTARLGIPVKSHIKLLLYIYTYKSYIYIYIIQLILFYF